MHEQNLPMSSQQRQTSLFSACGLLDMVQCAADGLDVGGNPWPSFGLSTRNMPEAQAWLNKPSLGLCLNHENRLPFSSLTINYQGLNK